MKITAWEPDLRTLVDRIENGDIDLQPEFQRQEVWSTAKKKKLIDTVLRGWSIPPVHLVVTETNLLEVLDGQQRLAAIRDFLSGKFSIDGNITPTDSRIKTLHGKFYKRLDSSDRRTFDQYPLRCFRLSDYSPEEPSELFYRLNQPTMLTAGEQRNALYGPARQQLKELVGVFIANGNERESIGFSNARLGYDDIIARLLYFIETGNFGIKGTESRISERFRQGDLFPEVVFIRAFRAVRHFSIARDAMGSGRFNKASLLSWLLFFARFDEDLPNSEFMGWFYKASDDATAGQDVRAAMALFDDRSSLRVTDVSSVVFRDVVLWYLWTVENSYEAPQQIPREQLGAISHEWRLQESFETAVEKNVDIAVWGASL